MKKQILKVKNAVKAFTHDAHKNWGLYLILVFMIKGSAFIGWMIFSSLGWIPWLGALIFGIGLIPVLFVIGMFLFLMLFDAWIKDLK